MSSMPELPEIEACRRLLEERCANKRASDVHICDDDGERFMCAPGTATVEHSPFSLPRPSTLRVVDLTEFLTDNFALGLGCVRNPGCRAVACLDVFLAPRLFVGPQTGDWTAPALLLYPIGLRSVPNVAWA